MSLINRIPDDRVRRVMVAVEHTAHRTGELAPTREMLVTLLGAMAVDSGARGALMSLLADAVILAADRRAKRMQPWRDLCQLNIVEKIRDADEWASEWESDEPEAKSDVTVSARKRQRIDVVR